MQRVVWSTGEPSILKRSTKVYLSCGVGVTILLAFIVLIIAKGPDLFSVSMAAVTAWGVFDLVREIRLGRHR